MHQRTEAAIALGTLIVLGTLVAILGRAPGPDRDRRASTFRTGPLGSQALFEAGKQLGIEVERFRKRPERLVPPDSDSSTLLAILDPSHRLSPLEVATVLKYSRNADLLLAGPGTTNLMRCFGYKIKERLFDSTTALTGGTAQPKMAGILVATGEASQSDSSRISDTGVETCVVPPIGSTTPLLKSAAGVVAVRLERADVDHAVLLVADANLFRNRTMRDTRAGPFALGLLVGHYDSVIFDEYHQGYGASGSLGGETVAWSLRSPWGWAVWQLAVVGILMLLVGGIRFGPIRRHRKPPRRSSFEHVRALATALSSAGGHDEAIAAMVRGLRRRLAVTTLRGRGDWHGWLERLGVQATTPRTANAVSELQELTSPGQSRASVLRAANAVEDVWESLQ